MHLYDLSLPLDAQTPVYPGDPRFKMRPVARMDSDGYCLSHLEMGSHTGTHIDAPCHCIPGGLALDAYPLARFYLTAAVLEVDSLDSLRMEDVVTVERNVQALLFKYRNRSPRGECEGLSRRAAERIVDAGRLLVGVESLSVDAAQDHDLPIHRLLLEHNVLILENICLLDVPPAIYRLMCFPLPIAGADGGPCRAVLGPI